MSRPQRYSVDQILDAARSLLAERGPAGVSVQAIAAAMGAPSGSIYHRFASRDLLLGELWLRTVERFQESVLPCLADADAFRAACGVSAQVLCWTRRHPDDARILMLYGSADLLAAGWPPALQQRTRQQNLAIEEALTVLAQRLGADGAAAKRRIRFAVIDLPYAGVREALRNGRVPEPELDDIVAAAVAAVLAPLHPKERPSKE